MLPAPLSRRPGFTLIELLVVISIIAILLALSASATVRVIDVQRGNNSEQTVKIVSEVLDRHWQAVVDKANRQEQIPPRVIALLESLQIMDPRVQRVVYVKLRLRQEFPIDFDEVLNPPANFPLPSLPAYDSALRGVPRPVAASQNSVCLLLALQQARGGITFDPDTLGSGAISVAQTIPPSNLKLIADGWAVPVVFYRWPTGNEELNPGGSRPGHNDPADPEGLLTTQSVAGNAPFRNWFGGVCHPIPAFAQSPRSHKLIPVVASAGRNGALGLNATTMAVTGAADLSNDNIYSHRLRFGARGD